MRIAIIFIGVFLDRTGLLVETIGCAMRKIDGEVECDYLGGAPFEKLLRIKNEN